MSTRSKSTRSKPKSKAKSKAKTLKSAPAPTPEVAAPTPVIGRPRRKALKPPTIHIRTAPAKESETLCGGSHSPIWNRSGDRPLSSVGPQQATKSTCGRCRRVATARGLV